MRYSVGLVVLGLVILQDSGSGHVVKRQDGSETSDDASLGSPSCPARAGTNDRCVPISRCPGLTTTTRIACALRPGSNGTGVCCPNDISTTSTAPFRAQTTTPAEEAEEEYDYDYEYEETINLEEDREELERKLLELDLFVKNNSASALHLAIVFADALSQALGKEFLDAESQQATTTPLNVSDPDSDDVPDVISEASSAGFMHKPSVCVEPQKTCTAVSKYRTYDGSCNNLEHTEWGMSHTAFQRLLPPLYADGISKPRRTSNGTALPGPRLISTTILNSNEEQFSNISLFLMAFGQFVDHDLTLTPSTRGANGTGIMCCPPEVPIELRHPECMIIHIPANDPFYGKFDQRCLEFMRTIPAAPKHCASPNDTREQINQLTDYLDGSMIYGSDERSAEVLRSKSGGKLLAEKGHDPYEFPPAQDGPACTKDENQRYCFITGDMRSAEQPPLATMHIAFFREHNRIADELAKLNPKWDDEVLYQETRRIVGAILQHIIYNEFLPVILGDGIMQEYNLTLHQEGFWDPYDPNVDVSILNEFATAAYRFGHSLVSSHIRLLDKDNAETVQLLREQFLKPYDVKLFDDYVRGLLVQSSNVMDESFTPDLTNHLFQTNGRFGLDLAALNIQRGRDHAIGTYTQARKICGLEDARSFQDLSKFMDSRIADQFSNLYDHVDDIDLWIGGVTEKPVHGAIIGPTFACIIAEQFKRTKVGDRFWYERGNTKMSFTEDQLRQIRQSSIARILCDNVDISKVQPLALLKPTTSNSPVECDSEKIPKMGFHPWRNELVGV